MGERAFSLAAVGHAPFDGADADAETLVAVLTEVRAATVYAAET